LFEYEEDVVEVEVVVENDVLGVFRLAVYEGDG